MAARVTSTWCRVLECVCQISGSNPGSTLQMEKKGEKAQTTTCVTLKFISAFGVYIGVVKRLFRAGKATCILLCTCASFVIYPSPKSRGKDPSHWGLRAASTCLSRWSSTFRPWWGDRLPQSDQQTCSEHAQPYKKASQSEAWLQENE